MKAAKELLDPISNHDNWTTLLQVAAREVFELMLSCELQPFYPESPASLEVTSMVGLAGELCGVLSVCCTRICRDHGIQDAWRRTRKYRQ
jgi:hypothetical protein